MRLWFAIGVARGFELEGGVLDADVEVLSDAGLELFEHARACPSWKQESFRTTCALSTGKPVAIWEACRSWTSRTCGTSRM